LGTRAVGATQWGVASSAVQGALHFIVGIALARLVAPEAFGLVALAAVVVGLASLISDFGLGPAIIRQRPLTTEHLRVGVTGSFLVGVGLALLLVAFAPFAGRLANSPDLPTILRVESLLFVFGGMGIPSRALLRRELAYKRLFLINAGSYLLGYGGVAIALAVMGYGVWSLVLGALVQSLTASVFQLASAGIPLRPLLRRAELRDLLGFGAGVSLNQVVNYVARNGDNFVVGRWLGNHELGLYARAYNLMMLPQTYFTLALTNVLYPTLCQTKDDRAKLARGYLMGVQVSALVTAPVMAVMIVSAPHLIVTLYGDAWVGAAPALQLLCAVGLCRSAYHVSAAVTQATGKIYAELQRQVVYSLLVVAGAVLGTRYGIAGVAIGVAAAIVYMYFAMARLSLALTGSSWLQFFGAQLPALGVGGVVALAASLTRLGLEQRGFNSPVVLAGIALASGGAAAAAIYLLPPNARPVELFSRLERASLNWPGLVRVPVRRILRVPQ
jgi:PST family polysaccharide transporter